MRRRFRRRGSPQRRLGKRNHRKGKRINSYRMSRGGIRL